MPKAPKKKNTRQHHPAVTEGVPEDPEPKVNLSQGQLDEVASKVAEKLLPLFNAQVQQPLPGPSSTSLINQRSVPVPGSSHEASREESDVPCICSQRWILAYLGFTFGAIFSMYRIDMSMAVVCMVKDAPELHTEALNGSDITNTSAFSSNETDEGPFYSRGCQGEVKETKQDIHNAEFTWDRQTQSVLLSAFFYGFVLTQIPGGWIIVRIGGKNVVTTSIALSSVFMLAIPFLARIHVTGVVVARILTGFVLGPLPPAWFALLGRWALPNERSRMMMMFWIGQTVGSVLGITTSGLLCAHGFDNGWGSIFYLHGSSGVLFLIFWIYCATNSPSIHPRISQREQTIIAKYLRTSKTTNEKVTKVPWTQMFTSSAVWAIFLTQLCDNWSYYLILTCLPLFVNEVLGFDIQSNGLYSSLPYVATVLSLLTSGVLADYVNKRQWVTRTTNRKIFQITSLVVSAGFLVLSSYLPCDRKQLVILCLSICTIFLHLAYASGYPCNLVDMTPRYAPFLYAVSNTIGASTGFVAPLAVGILTKHKSIEEWRFVFWVSAGIALIGAVIYGLFSSSELQPWDPAYTRTIEIDVPMKLYQSYIKQPEESSTESDKQVEICTKPLIDDLT